MLCAGGDDLVLSASQVWADDTRGGGLVNATYTFPPTKREVHNLVNGAFVLRDGLIAEHIDTFNLYRWSRQALGPTGTLLGWTPWLQRRIRRDAARGLERWMERKPSATS